MAFLGKEYKFVSQENFDAFLKAAGLPDAEAAKLLEYKPSTKLDKNGDSYTYTSAGPTGTKETHFTPGVQIERVFHNLPMKTVYTVDGNKVIEESQVEGKGTATFTREYNGDDLVVSITSSKFDGVAKRFYKA